MTFNIIRHNKVEFTPFSLVIEFESVLDVKLIQDDLAELEDDNALSPEMDDLLKTLRTEMEIQGITDLPKYVREELQNKKAK